MNPKETAMKIAKDFDSLTANYQSIIATLIKGLAPNTPQEKRDELRKIFAPLTKK
jgi:hypothetical protein